MLYVGLSSQALYQDYYMHNKNTLDISIEANIKGMDEHILNIATELACTTIRASNYKYFSVPAVLQLYDGRELRKWRYRMIKTIAGIFDIPIADGLAPNSINILYHKAEEKIVIKFIQLLYAMDERLKLPHIPFYKRHNERLEVLKGYFELFNKLIKQ